MACLLRFAGACAVSVFLVSGPAWPQGSGSGDQVDELFEPGPPAGAAQKPPAQGDGKLDYWEKNSAVAPECEALNHKHKQETTRLHESRDPQANRELAAQRTQTQKALDSCVRSVLLQGGVTTNVTAARLKGQFDAYYDGGKDRIYIDLAPGAPVGERFQNAPIRSETGYYTHIDGVLTRSATAPSGYELNVTGLHGPAGYETTDRRVQLK